MSRYKIKELLDNTSCYNDSLAYGDSSLSVEERLVLAFVAKKLLKLVINEIDLFEKNGYVKNETLFLFGTNNKDILKTKPLGELFFIKIESSDLKTWRYHDQVIETFFGERLSWTDFNAKTNQYELAIVYTKDANNWPFEHVVDFILFAKNHLKSQTIQDFFESVDDLADSFSKKKDLTKNKTEQKRAQEFCTKTQKWMAKEILLHYLVKDKPVSVNLHNSILLDTFTPDWWKEEDCGWICSTFSFEGSAFYLATLLTGASIDRTGRKLLDALLTLLGEEWFSKLKFVANPDFRRLYFLYGPEVDLALGALDCDAKVRLASELKLKRLTKKVG